MSAIAFDTHAFVKRLTAAGIPEPQAEILADQQAKLIDEKLATKTDIAMLKSHVEEVERRLGADLRATELRLEAQIANSKSEIIKWMFGTIGFQTIAIRGAAIALTRFGHG